MRSAVELALRIGDRVRRKDGGPMMDVLSIVEDRAECLHFVGDVPHIAFHPLAELEIVSDGPSQDDGLASRSGNSANFLLPNESIACADAERGVFVVVTADEEGHRSAKPLRGFLERIRKAFEMDVVFVSQFQGGQRIIRQAAADPADRYAVPEGASDPLEESYCQRVVDGRLPQLMEDAAAHPDAAKLPGTKACKVGCHLSTPIVGDDGTVFGTLCCFSHEPRHDVTSLAKLQSLKVVAGLLADALSRDKA